MSDATPAPQSVPAPVAPVVAPQPAGPEPAAPVRRPPWLAEAVRYMPRYGARWIALLVATLIALGRHYGFLPRACRPYRAKTKGKVERPFSYIRQDFFLGRSFRNLDDLNGQLDDWLATVANVRLHGTTQRIVSEAFAAEQPELQKLPTFPFDALLKLERRVSHDGLVSIGGNYYSVPDRTRRSSRSTSSPTRSASSMRGETGRHPSDPGRAPAVSG